MVCTPNLKPSYTTSLRPKLTHFCEWLNRLVTLAHVKLKIRRKCSLTAGGTLDDSIGWLSPSPLGPWIVSGHLFLRYMTRNRTGMARSNPPRLETTVNNKRFKPFCFLTFHDHLPPQKIFNTHKLFFLSGLVDQLVGKRRSTPEVVINHTLVRAFFYPRRPNAHIDIGKYATVLLPLLNELV